MENERVQIRLKSDEQCVLVIIIHGTASLYANDGSKFRVLLHDRSDEMLMRRRRGWDIKVGKHA